MISVVLVIFITTQLEFQVEKPLLCHTSYAARHKKQVLLFKLRLHFALRINRFVSMGAVNVFLSGTR